MPDVVETPKGLRARIDAGVVTVDLRSGDGENRVSVEMASWLSDLLVAPPPGSHILHLRSAGPAFCLGPAPPPAGVGVAEMVGSLLGLNRALMETSMVTLTEVDGLAAGFGAGLACLPDITLASQRAGIVFPEVKNGVLPALVLSWLVDYVGIKESAWLTLTGTQLGAEDACSSGLFSKVTTPESLREAVDLTLESLRSCDDECLLEIRRYLRDRRGIDRGAAEDLALNRTVEWAQRRAQP